MPKQKTDGFAHAHYENVGESYLSQRKLKGSAGFWLLWSLGVGVVISGDFTG